MSHPNPNEEFAGQVKNCSFTTTNWKAVLASQGNDSLEAQQALEELCRTYWYPLYVFLRRNGHSPEEAEDLTQGLFAHLIKTGALAQVDREKGRFRDFLLACLKNHARTVH